MAIRLGPSRWHYHFLKDAQEAQWPSSASADITTTCSRVALELNACFFMDMFDYVRHVVRVRRVEIAAHSDDTIQKLKKPCNITRLRSFTELCEVFRRFVPSFSRTEVLFNYDLQEDQPVKFGPLNKADLETMTTLKRTNFSTHLSAVARWKTFYLGNRHM